MHSFEYYLSTSHHMPVPCEQWNKRQMRRRQWGAWTFTPTWQLVTGAGKVRKGPPKTKDVPSGLLLLWPTGEVWSLPKWAVAHTQQEPVPGCSTKLLSLLFLGYGQHMLHMMTATQKSANNNNHYNLLSAYLGQVPSKSFPRIYTLIPFIL